MARIGESIKSPNCQNGGREEGGGNVARKMKPKGARGRAAVKRLGRNYKTGNFAKIARKAAKRYGSAEIGRKVAAKIYWQKVRKRKRS